MITVYKVLEITKEGFRSAGAIPSNMKSIYKFGEKNYGKIPGSKVFVFNDFSNAEFFQRDIRVRHTAIFECECESLTPLEMIPNLWNVYDKEQEREELKKFIMDFWIGKDKNLGKEIDLGVSKLKLAGSVAGVYVTDYINLIKQL